MRHSGERNGSEAIMRSSKKPTKRRKHTTKATTSKPQEEFINIPNRPSVPQRAAEKGLHSRRRHIPPVSD